MAFSERTTKTLKCMNHEPATSKYGEFAPIGGCDVEVEVDSNCAKVLCSTCTQRVVNLNYTRSWADE
jgi:hypothetical protein